jgi:epoxyqueuosine reductase
VEHSVDFQLAADLKVRARELGFDRVGIAPAHPSRYRDYFRQWLDAGQAGSMDYLASRFAERTDPGAYLPGAASVICVGLNYYAPLSPPDEPADHGRIARYALGDDYHELIKQRLHRLADWLRQARPDALTRCSVDTAPVMEKELAVRAGIGWLGKNTCVINEQIGSWLLLGEVLSTVPLPTDDPAIDRCGTCRRCIDACPTQALEPYRLDASRCISYFTIEHRGQIPAEMASQFGDWIYGCDICQDVCPWNHRALPALDPRLAPRFATGTLDLAEVLEWTAGDYRRQLRNSAMKRVKLPVLQRNAAIAAANASNETAAQRQ